MRRRCPLKSPLAVLALALLPSVAAAADDAHAPALPAWLQQKIAHYRKLPPFNPPRSILRAQYDGKTVYYVSPACCDIPSELYAEGGALLCYPDGGFAGGDGRCPSFTFVDNTVSTVWRDGRNAGGRGPEAAPPKR